MIPYDGQNSMDWTCEQALKEAHDVVAKNEPDGLLIIALWNQGRNYDTAFRNVGLSLSQTIALLEIMKSKMLKMLEESCEQEGF